VAKKSEDERVRSRIKAGIFITSNKKRKGEDVKAGSYDWDPTIPLPP